MKKITKIAAAGFLLTALGTAGIFAAKPNYDANGEQVGFFKELFVGKEKYIEYDEVSLQTNNVMLQQKERNSTMIYNPQTKQAGVSTYFQTMFFNFTFSEADRILIKDALDSYLDDFANKKLIHNNNKSTKMYGKGKCFAEFGTVKQMMNHEANTTFKAGYRFEKKSPYFVISVQGAKDERENQPEYTVKNFPTVTMYFTRSQAKDFVAKLDEAQLNALQAEYDEKVSGFQNRIIKEKDDYNSPEVDEYEE